MNNFEYLVQSKNCRVNGHQQNRINRICIESGCKETRLVCDQCEGLHKSHREKLLPAAEFERSLKDFESSAQVLNNIGLFDTMIEDFAEFSQTIVKSVIDELQKLLDASNFMKNEFLKHGYYSYEELDGQMNQLLKFVALENGDIKFKVNLNPSDCYSQIKMKLTQYQEEINSFWKNNKESRIQKSIIAQIEQQKQQLPPQHEIEPQQQDPQNQTNNLSLQIKTPQLQEQLDSILFSQEFCSKQIKCISPKCIRKIGNINTNDIACLNKPLSLLQSQETFFKINRLTGYIGIGISIFQQVQENNFIFGDLNKVGHGIFMVLNNGLVYNNTDSKFNKFAGPFKLYEGQKYKLTFDPWNVEGKQFSLESLSQKPSTFFMPMQIVEGYDYHFFVYMGQKDGEVELLDEI